MKVIVFGATGSVGRLAVERLLAEGHSVTAFARNPDLLDLEHPALDRHAGDVLDTPAVDAAVTGHHAVMIALGAGASRRSRVRSEGTLNVIRAMQAHNIRRLVCQSTLGTFESRGNLNFLWKYVMFGVLLRPVLRDHELQEQMVRASGLDWTIVRPAAFVDGPATGNFREDFPATEQGLSLQITRADIADFLTRVVKERSYLGKAVAISG